MPTIMPPVIASPLLLPRHRVPRRDKSLIQELHTDFCARSSRNVFWPDVQKQSTDGRSTAWRSKIAHRRLISVRMIMPSLMKRRVGALAALPSGDSDPTHHPAFNRKEIKDESHNCPFYVSTVNALIAASFCRNCAALRNSEIGFESVRVALAFS
jgi:hypothetical protein